LPREDRQDVEARLLEQVHHVVVPDVDQAKKLALRNQRRDHHRAQLEVQHAFARVEHGIVDRITHDQRLPRIDAAP
jgi:hypothetical protein